jgi:hypothetical protein
LEELLRIEQQGYGDLFGTEWRYVHWIRVREKAAAASGLSRRGDALPDAALDAPQHRARS